MSGTQNTSTELASDAQALIEALVQAGGGSITGIILFGSQLVNASSNPYSAWDFVVIVDDYPAFHEALVRTGHHVRSPGTLTFLAGILAPSITAFSPTSEGRPVAKCAIVDRAGFRRALAPRSSDHFLKGRMVQQVRVAWTRDPQIATELESRLAEARLDVLDWAGPRLTLPMTPESVPLEMLQLSYGGEVRPEAGDRVLEVVAAQRIWLTQAYTEVLRQAAENGTLVEEDGGYRFRTPISAGHRLRIRLYFIRSKIRATTRWGKHILTFNDWLTYIQRKAERRTGLTLEVTAAERRWPLILLWPKVFGVLRARNASNQLPGEPK